MVIYFLNFNHSFLKLNVCRYEQILYIKKNVHFLFKSMLCSQIRCLQIHLKIVTQTNRQYQYNALGVPSHTLAVFLFNSPRANPTLFFLKSKGKRSNLTKDFKQKVFTFWSIDHFFLCKMTFPQLITSIEEQT